MINIPNRLASLHLTTHQRGQELNYLVILRNNHTILNTYTMSNGDNGIKDSQVGNYKNKGINIKQRGLRNEHSNISLYIIIIVLSYMIVSKNLNLLLQVHLCIHKIRLGSTQLDLGFKSLHQVTILLEEESMTRSGSHHTHPLLNVCTIYRHRIGEDLLINIISFYSSKLYRFFAQSYRDRYSESNENGDRESYDH